MRSCSWYVGALACLAGLVLATASCGADGREAREPGESSPAATSPASPTTGTAASTDDPTDTTQPAAGDHAVDPPGRRTGRWTPPDIIVTGARTIDEDTIEEIAGLAGVTDVEPISRVRIPIQNRTLDIAAVDPATYRNYVTSLASANATEVWKRIAAGELGLRPGLRVKLPFDDDDFLRLGSTEDAPEVHLGAVAQQTWQVDAVVNDSWVEDLGMTRDNALLIRTGSAAPDTLRGPIERILRGTEASVQMTDAVARYGIDPDVVQTAVVVGTVADAVGTYRYTVLSGGRIEPDPAWVASHITTETVPILGSVTCNKLMIPQLRAALLDVVSQGLADKIHPDEYAGCYNARFIAGSTQLSNHAFGLALDLNVPGNQRGTVGEMDRSVVAIFKRWGFAWGGDWNYTDPMHFEMNRLVRPG